MNKKIPMIGLTIGLLFAIVLKQFSHLNGEAEQTLPMLASLFMAELGVILTGYSAFVSAKLLQMDGKSFNNIALLAGNLLLSINFLSMGFSLWQIMNG